MKPCICINDKNPVSNEQTLFRTGQIYEYEFVPKKGEYELNISPISLPPDMFEYYMMDLRIYREIQLAKVCEVITH